MVEKWSINRLSDETGKDRRTLKKILAKVAPIDEVSGDPVYSLRDFMDAWLEYDDVEQVEGEESAQQWKAEHEQ